MVKVQKRSPKTLQQGSVQGKANNSIKKSKIKQTKNLAPKMPIAVLNKDKKLEEKPIICLPKDNLILEKCSDDSKKPVLQKNNVKGKKALGKQVVPKNKEELNQQKKITEKKQLNQHNKLPIAPIESQKTEVSPVDKIQKRKIAIKTFNDNQKKKRMDNEVNKKPVTTIQFETVPFDEEKFNAILSLKNIKNIGNALKVLVEKEVTEKKTSIFSDYRYFLNVSCYKIPNCPKRMVKLNLKHSLVDTSTDDIVIIVPDLQRGAKVDYEPTIQHYEDLFREVGVTNLKIVPFNQLRNECTTFETKRKFANTYDYFLCDGRIVSHVVGFCGKNFQKPRTTFHAVRLDNPKTYKSDIEHALNRTSYKQLEKGDLISIPVGNHRYTDNQLADNIKLVVEQLKNSFPGGYANIRNIHIKIDIKGTSSIPLFVNLAGAPLETPHVIGTREQRMIKLKKEANDVLSKFSLSKTGDIVKLNKAQIKRKQEMREVRESLLSEETVDASTEKNKAVSISKKDRKENKKVLGKHIKSKTQLVNKKDDHEESEDDNGEDAISDIGEDDDDKGSESDEN